MPSSTDTIIKVYNQSASQAASQIIARYSSSFSLATRLLSEPTRTDIRNLYAVVRIADEIVDGTALLVGGNLPLYLTNTNNRCVRLAVNRSILTLFFKRSPILLEGAS